MPILRRAVLFVAVLLLCLLVTVPAASAQAADHHPAASFVLRPAAGSETSPNGGWFAFTAAPGGVAQGAVALRNDGPEPISVSLAPVDARSAQQGGVEYALADEEPRAVGTWLELAQTVVHLAPGGSATVPMRVRVPDDASPGDHLGGVAAWVPVEATNPGDDGGMSAGVTVQTRQVVAVELDVPGDADAKLVIRDVRVAARPSGPYLEVLLANTGGRLIKAEGRIVLADRGLEQDFTVDTMVPGTDAAFPVVWAGEDLSEVGRVTVTLRYDGGEAAWEGVVQPGAEVARAMDDWAPREASASPLGAGRGPLALAVGASGLLCVLATVLWQAGSRRRTAVRPGPGS